MPAMRGMVNLRDGGQSSRMLALVHESELARNDPNPEACHRPMAYDSGLPRSVIRFRTLHARTASVRLPCWDCALEGHSR